MSDINLLPEDLRKNESKILQGRGSFSYTDTEVEYTPGEKLQKNGIGVVVDKDNSKSRNTTNNFNKNIATPYVEKNINIEKERAYNPPVLEKKNIVSESNENKNKKVGQVRSKMTLGKFLAKIDLALRSKKTKKMESGINLIPESLKAPSNKVLFFTFFYPLLIVVGIVLVIYSGLKIYDIQIQNNIKDVDNQVTSVVESAGDYNKLIVELEDWQNKTKKIKNILTKHIYWTEFFRKLEDNTLANVKFNNFSGNIQGNLTFLATAPDYTTVVRQWMHLKRAKDFVKNVIISGATLSTGQAAGSGGVSFSVTLDLAEDIFYKTE